MKIIRIAALAAACVCVATAAIAQTAASGGAPPVVVAPAPAIIDTGTYAGSVLTWVMATFGTTIGAALTALLLRMAKKAGIQGVDLFSSRLQELVVNGLNAGAAEAAKNMAGKGEIQVKNEAMGSMVRYVQVHGADVLKKLGQDPFAQATVDALKARAETAIADPTAPTNAALGGPDTQTAPGRS